MSGSLAPRSSEEPLLGNCVVVDRVEGSDVICGVNTHIFVQRAPLPVYTAVGRLEGSEMHPAVVPVIAGGDLLYWSINEHPS